MACTQVASWRLYLLSNMTTHASSCRSMPCHAVSETKAHQNPIFGNYRPFAWILQYYSETTWLVDVSVARFDVHFSHTY